MSEIRAVAIIPARYASTRFPGKPLADQTGRPLIRHVYDRAIRAQYIERVIVATDDARIADAVRAFGGEVRMTRADHANGTSRLAEAVADLPHNTIIVNVQGDEPEIEPDCINRVVEALAENPEIAMATLAAPFGPDEDPADPNIVKVVTTRKNRALYFSRALIPSDRDRRRITAPLKHIGLYVYRREFLLTYVGLAPTPLECSEQLEQLRVLESGYAIAVVTTGSSPHAGIDTPEQYAAFVRRWRAQHQQPERN